MFLRKKSHNETMEMLTKFALQSTGIPLIGEIRLLHDGSANSYNYWRSRVQDANIHSSVYKAENAMVTKRNDVMLVTPDSHAWKGDTDSGGEALTWDKQNTHMLGLTPSEKGGYQRARFGHSGFTMANFATVSGNANLFKNLRFMHGSSTGGASDVRVLTVSGAGNVFDHVNFGTPIDQTQASSANFRGVTVSGSSNHFKDCLFGTQNAIHRDAANFLLELSGGGLNIFENCIFRSRSAATSPFFMLHSNAATGGNLTAAFLNCQFINVSTLAGSYDLAVGISNTAAGTHYLYFDSRCSFSGVTNVVTSGQEAKIYWGSGGAGPDTSALADRLNLGLASNVAT